MSEHSDIISFDLQEGKGSILDISSLFPFASVHAIRSTKPILDTLRIGAGRVYDFSLSYRLSLKRFRTLETLDLSTPELWQPNILSTRILKIRPRFSTIDLVPPLDIPFESLDLRNEVPVPSVKRYPDLFRRDLPISLHMRREWKHIRRAVWIRKKSILSTLLLCILLTLPSLWYTKVLVEDGYAKLSNIRVLTDREVILSSIQDSKRDFERSNILFALFRFIPNDQIRLVRMAIDGGLALTRGIDTLVARLPDAPLTVSGSQVLTDTSSDTVAPDYRGKARDIALLAPLGIDLPTDWLEKNQDAIISFQVALQDAAKAFAQAQSITDPRRDELMHYSRTFLELSRIIAFYTDHEKDLLTMLGHTEPERYIVFNQNRDEIRANGGFPGSVITFTLYKGNILDYRTDDIYYFDWNLYPYKETPPPGLALLTDSYGLRDVNYYPDFHETLEKANAFVERSGDATLTTGIALHQGLIEDILASVGPVTLSGILIPFTSENFSPLMSTLVEARTGAEKTPKDILFRFIGALGKKIHEKRSYDLVLNTVESALQNGEILFASRDAGVDGFLDHFREPLPWECNKMNNEQGTMNNEYTIQDQEPATSNQQLSTYSCPRNWVYPILTSVSGNKSDRFIKRQYTAETHRVAACQYENKLTLTHTHTYTQADTEKENTYLDLAGLQDPKARQALLAVEGNGKNRTYMRLYVPKGSTLTGSSIGVESIEKPDATVFTWTFETPVGSESSKTIRYVTDIPDCQSFSGGLTWIRQPGLQHTTMKGG